jgi:hypothetical protein
MISAATALAPRTHVTAVSQRPSDSDFAYFVQFYEPRHGVRIMWTDSRAHAEAFAVTHRCYARTAKVQERSEWAAGRSINLSREATVVK